MPIEEEVGMQQRPTQERSAVDADATAPEGIGHAQALERHGADVGVHRDVAVLHEASALPQPSFVFEPGRLAAHLGRTACLFRGARPISMSRPVRQIQRSLLTTALPSVPSYGRGPLLHAARHQRAGTTPYANAAKPLPDLASPLDRAVRPVP